MGSGHGGVSEGLCMSKWIRRKVRAVVGTASSVISRSTTELESRTRRTMQQAPSFFKA